MGVKEGLVPVVFEDPETGIYTKVMPGYGPMVNGVREGTWKAFDEGYHILISKGDYRNGVKDGPWETLWNNEPIIEMNYKNGVLDGEFESHYRGDPAVILSLRHYKNGVEDGLVETFDRNGRVKTRAFYENGIKISG